MLARASAAGKVVRKELGAERRPKAQADAVAASLGRLHPPPVVQPEHETQVATYTRIAESARGLADALRTGRRVRARLRAVEVAAASGSTVSAQKARSAGIAAFDRRVKHVTTLAARAQRERNRLQRLLA